MRTKDAIEQVFNHDIETTGSYLYTHRDVYSAQVATYKQTNEINKLLNSYFPDKPRIIDMGCGDGTFTFQLFKDIHPKLIIGFDVAQKAIEKAQKSANKLHSKTIRFDTISLYSMSTKYSSDQFDVGILRGVLHHLDHPQDAIREMSKVVDAIILLEPNGYNPILKLIEKISYYHRIHREKSYWPPTIDQWFTRYGYQVTSKKYFSIIPYFFPTICTKYLKKLEPFFEHIPRINRFYCGGILTLYKKEKVTTDIFR